MPKTGPTLRRYATRWALPVLLLLVWQYSAGDSSGYSFPTPAQILLTGTDQLLAGNLLSDVSASLSRIAVGFGISSLLAIFFGLSLGLVRPLEPMVRPTLELLRPIPPIAWIPIAILWFGIGDRPAYFLVAIGAFFPTFTNTLAGVRSVKLVHLRAAQSLGAGPWLILKKVILPSALPLILAGLRTGLGVGWICVITAELVGAQSGLGYMIQLNRLLLQTDAVILGMMTIGLLGYLMSAGALLIENHLTRWNRAATLDGLQENDQPL